MSVPSSRPIRAALSEFHAGHNLGPDGGVSDRWVRIRVVGPVSFYFPNFEARRRAVLMHDLHHIAAGYGTSLLAEAEIAAWEIGAGCAGCWAAWVLNGAGLGYGIPLAPRRTFRAFVRGRGCRTLYMEPFDEAVLEGTVGDLRRRLLLDTPGRAAPGRDVVVFGAWAAGMVMVDVAFLALVGWGVWALVRRIVS